MSEIKRTESESQKRQNYKKQKETYRTEKKRVASELLTTLQDPTVVVMADWLKIRGTLRKWTRLFCVLKPGLFLLYKTAKTNKPGYWVGTVLLSTCELIERPSKKNGFCFKLFHPLDQSIWATRGPHGESIPAVTMPLPSSYLICRTSAEDAGRCWMDALELALRCSSLLLRTMNKELRGSSTALSSPDGIAESTTTTPAGSNTSSLTLTSPPSPGAVESATVSTAVITSTPATGLPPSGSASRLLRLDSVSSPDVLPRLDEREAEKHFCEEGLDDGRSESGSELEEETVEAVQEETHYISAPPEVFGASGDAEQVEEVADENKSLIWSLMKQVRPGMDLSRVVLPTFILEPRSFLEKLSDFYYHVDLLQDAVTQDDPFERIKAVVKFYLSGFYKKPKGLKKPYNPIIGEVYRCYWDHGGNNKSFYIAEQVSHHPPVSAFFVSNRKIGYNISGSILARSKFYGNSLSALMVGTAKLTLLTRGETYIITFPYAHCKGLLLGTLTMELGGTVTVVSDKTSYSAELEFKLKPLLSGSEAMNVISGKIKLGKETMATIEGHWDTSIVITDKQTGKTDVLWQADSSAIERRLHRCIVPVKNQETFESERLWQHVTEAIVACDQVKATEQKTVVEEMQRKKAREMKEKGTTHDPKLFQFEPLTGLWTYKHADFRPWDPQNDVVMYENKFMVKTRVKHQTPLIRSTSYVKATKTKLPRANITQMVVEDSEEEDSHGSKDSLVNSAFVDSSASPPKKSSPEKVTLASLHTSIVNLSQQMSVVQYKLDTMANRNAADGHNFWYCVIAAIFFGVMASVLFPSLKS